MAVHNSTTMTLPRTRTAPAPTPGRAPAQPGVRPHVPHGKSRGRLGSQQVVSVRGRRVAAPVKPKHPIFAVSGIALTILAIGVAVAMVLSGMSTTQTFTIQQLQSQERMLQNEVESLNRDLEDLRSSAEIAQRAADAGMVVAAQPGIMEVTADGALEQRREPNPEAVAPVVDVNGAPTRADRATSDRRAVDEVVDNLTQVPGGNVLGEDAARPEAPANTPDTAGPRLDNVAPYQPNVPAAF